MRRGLPAIALMLLCTQAWAETNVDIDCNVESGYEFSLTERSVIYTRDSGAPKTVLMRNGRLFIDDKWVTVNAADRGRIASYEREAREMMPLLQQIGRDATEIAFTALGEVAMAFSSDPADTRASLAKARAKLDARLARSVTAKSFNSEDLGNGIGEAVREALPTIIGDIAGGAIRAAFSGDNERLQRMDNIDKEIEARIAPREKALERNAQLLCSKMEALDRIDNAFEYRLPSGKSLDLLTVKREARKPDQKDKGS